MGGPHSRGKTVDVAGMAASKAALSPVDAHDVVVSGDAVGEAASVPHRSSQTSAHAERLQKILEMIDSGIPCTVEVLAAECNLSHSRLQHLFKQKTGISLGQRLTQQRLARAAHLLTSTDKRIKDIARIIGYEHASSFIRAFERHFAQAPRRFRQTQKRKAASAC